MNSKLTYTIQQVADITGLSKQVIRKWEDRYGIINPARLDNGYRIYSEQEVILLSKIVALVNQGYSIKQAAHLAQTQIKQEKDVEQVDTSLAITSRYTHYLTLLEQSGHAANDEAIIHLLQQAHHEFGVEKLLKNIILPFLIKIGQLWEDKLWGEYQEAISSQAIRDFLINIRRTLYVPKEAPLIVGSCLPEERHEIPMQILLVQCMLLGYRTIMLGPAPAPDAIQSTVRLTNPKAVMLSGTTDNVLKDNGLAIQELDAFAATVPNTKFFIGGAIIRKYSHTFHFHALTEAHTLHDVLSVLEKK